MPTGQKTIVWTEANDERLLLSILAVHNIKVDGTSVAKVFGNNIAPSAIQGRMAKLKAKARALNPGANPTDAVVPSATKRTRVTSKTTSGTAKKKVKKEPTEDDGSTVDNVTFTQLHHANDHTVTPPATPSKKASDASTTFTKLTTPSPKAGHGVSNGQVQAKRCSPRESAKPDYRKLDDPFVYMEGGMGQDDENVFRPGMGSESENSLDSYKDVDAEETSVPA